MRKKSYNFQSFAGFLRIVWNLYQICFFEDYIIETSMGLITNFILVSAFWDTSQSSGARPTFWDTSQSYGTRLEVLGHVPKFWDTPQSSGRHPWVAWDTHGHMRHQYVQYNFESWLNLIICRFWAKSTRLHPMNSDILSCHFAIYGTKLAFQKVFYRNDYYRCVFAKMHFNEKPNGCFREPKTWKNDVFLRFLQL